MSPLQAQNRLQTTSSPRSVSLQTAWSTCIDEHAQVDWLILHFNRWFSHYNVILVRGEHEPEYFPATNMQPARIQFAHGFFNSALHEISHWCIAGAQRRTLPDLGYWYAPDGRTAEQQRLFEQVEVKPQALEWLFAQACLRPFRVSLDNLTGAAGNGTLFKDHVFAQVQRYLAEPTSIPKDGLTLIQHLCNEIRAGKMLHNNEFSRQTLD
ncbi:MAG: elongation factor P hydroxylase [Acinetobacter populi]|jgi:elongation factor P hydroxylase|uniref:elongation factor P hydroxylase n=1 Tax=Acinetobacter populi TaxID=1582270 RepID=UPI002355EE2E|nr:elongation factor P hydroxylase [Acinetobacter populi]MCH4248346.1 elongation factor P hydroxylase [Acinetobacter populi]